MKAILKWFFNGLLVLLPIAATLYVVQWVFVKLNDTVFRALGQQVARSEETSAGITILGIGVSIGIIIVVGMLTSNFLGKVLVRWVDALFRKLPLVKLLHGSIKDLLGAFVGDKKSFDKPVLVSLAGDGSAKVVGFVTRDDLEFLGVAGHVAVYLPQSYNFAGNLMVFPRDQIQLLDAESSDVMAFLVSGGVSGDDDA